MEAWLVDWLSDSFYRRRKQLSGGEKGNGFEMWRWMFNEFQSGSDAINLGGSRRLQDWPRYSKIESLSAHLDDWVDCLETYSAELLSAPGTLRSMILGVIPNEFEDELLSKPNVKTWQEIVEWCKIKTVYKRQKVLSEQARKPGGRVAALLVGPDEPEVQDRTDPEEPPAWFKDYINKLDGGNRKPPPRAPRSPSPGGSGSRGASPRGGKPLRIKFEGCWHCGTKGHSRGQCELFKKLMAEANKNISDRTEWKLPEGYKGKYEEAKAKARAASKKRVNALDGGMADGECTEGDD